MINLEIVKYNYDVLVDRKRHQKFHVNSDGKLEVITSFFEKMKFFFLRSHRAKIQSEVELAVRHVVEHCGELSQTDAEVQSLFFKTLAPLSTKVFDRKSLSKDIQNLLAQEIIEERDLGVERIQDITDVYEKNVVKVKLAMKLGTSEEFGLVLNPSGASGSYIGKDIKGKKRLIFKPSDESPESGRSPKLRSRITYYFKKIPYFRQHENLDPDQTSDNEARAYTLDQQLCLHIVPPTKMEEFESKKFMGRKKLKRGSCQMWAPKATVAKNLIKNNRAAIDDISFEKLVCLDFLLGNQDRHHENWLINQNHDKSGWDEEFTLFAIDNGSSFPHGFFKSFASKVHMYSWRTLKNAKRPFEHIDYKNFKFDFDQLNFPDTKNGKMQKKMLKQRIKVLKDVIANGENMSVLGEIRDEKEFKERMAKSMVSA